MSPALPMSPVKPRPAIVPYRKGRAQRLHLLEHRWNLKRCSSLSRSLKQRGVIARVRTRCVKLPDHRKYFYQEPRQRVAGIA